MDNIRNILRDSFPLHLSQAAPTRASRVTVVPGLTVKQNIIFSLTSILLLYV
jgi:hypothetical protein